MSDENKKLTNLKDEAVDGEKIKGGMNSLEPTMQMPGFETPGIDSDPNVVGLDPAIEGMPGNIPQGGFTPTGNLPGDINPEMDEGLIHGKNPNSPKI